MFENTQTPIKAPARGNAPRPKAHTILRDHFNGIHLAIILILAVSVIPITTGVAIFQGVVEEGSVMIENTKADIWIVQQNNTHLFEPSLIHENLSSEIEDIMGVGEFHYLIFHKISIEIEDNQICSYIVGFNITSGMGGPWDIISGDIAGLEGDNTVFVDSSIEKYFDSISMGDSITLGQTNHTIVGISENAKYFDSPYIFTSYENARKIIDSMDDKTSFILVEVAPTKDPYYVSNELSKIHGIDAYLSSEFRKNTAEHEVYESGLAGVITLISVTVFFLGLVLILLIGHGMIEQDLQGIGFKQKEVTVRQLFTHLIFHSITDVGVGCIIGLTFSFIIMIVLSSSIFIPVVISIESMALGLVFLFLLYTSSYLLVNGKDYLAQNWKHLLVNVLSIIFLLLVWYLLVEAARSGNQFLLQRRFHQLPTPLETWDAFMDSFAPSEEGVIYRASILDHAQASIWRVLVGFCLAALVGIPSGLVMGRSRYASDFGGPIVELIRPIPPLAWIGIGLLIFTFNVGYFIVFIGCVFPLILSTVNGVKGVDEGLIEAARTLGAKKLHILRKVVIPGSLPSIVTGMRIGLGIGWMSIVAAEMVGMREGLGLGYYVWISYDSYGAYDNMVAAMLLIGFIGWLMNYIIQKAEKRMIRWQE